MRAIRIAASDLENPTPLLEIIMNQAFDCAFTTDRNGKILQCADTAPLIFGVPIDEIIGSNIEDLECGSILVKYIRGDKVELSKMLVLNGIFCFVHTIPLFDSGETHIGAFCGIVHRGMEKLRSILEDVNVEEETKLIEIAYTNSNSKYTFNDFIGVSPEILNAIRISKKAAQFDYTVLVRGETGTGKELIASGIHAESSKNKNLPFIKINCTAIPRELLESELFGHEKGAFTGAFTTKKGKFELAGEGTVLLDEIGDMDISLQSKLLRVLEEREFERVGGSETILFRGRVIASTNRNLEWMIKAGKFREDLYYRLSTVEINLPPVRNSTKDILLLINYFMKKSNVNIPFSPGAIGILKNYDWPGNVRQIKNVIAKLSMIEDVRLFRADHVREILMPILQTDHISNDNEEYEERGPSSAFDRPKRVDTSDWERRNPNLYSPKSFFESPENGKELNDLSDVEKNHIIETLKKTNSNVAASARLLNISRNTLYNKIKKYNINLKKIVLPHGDNIE